MELCSPESYCCQSMATARLCCESPTQNFLAAEFWCFDWMWKNANMIFAELGNLAEIVVERVIESSRRVCKCDKAGTNAKTISHFLFSVCSKSPNCANEMKGLNSTALVRFLFKLSTEELCCRALIIIIYPCQYSEVRCWKWKMVKIVTDWYRIEWEWVLIDEASHIT